MKKPSKESQKKAKPPLPKLERPLPGPSTEMDRWLEDLPVVRISTLNPDGSLSGYQAVSVKHFGGTVPNVGDVIGVVWADSDYDFQVVQRRYFITEFEGDNYWLLVVRDAEPAPPFDAVSTNALLVTDLERAVTTRRPPKEISDRISQLTGRETPGVRKIKPKPREPDGPSPETLALLREMGDDSA